MRVCVLVLLAALAGMAAGEVYFKETFDSEFFV
jgi:hypothetical protein